jgi:hypothetical protein
MDTNMDLDKLKMRIISNVEEIKHEASLSLVLNLFGLGVFHAPNVIIKANKIREIIEESGQCERLLWDLANARTKAWISIITYPFYMVYIIYRIIHGEF